MYLPFTLGTDPDGREVVLDLAEMPHLLIAGTTGSGKSTFLHGLLCDLIGNRVDARYMLFDPKRVELSTYRPYVTSTYVEDEDMAIAFEWLAEHMDERFVKLERQGVRDLASYNEQQPLDDHMPRIVVVVDEMANLMLGPMKARIERPLTRLAQMARAVGIHLVLATQRPTVDVVTGLLRANIPGRVAFSVITQADSRIILDEPGAEDLRGKGDMLVRIPGTKGLHRLQGSYTSIEDVERVIKRITEVTR